MKRSLITLLNVCAFLSVTAQTVFDIQIDKIYFTGDQIALVNEGETNTYLCGILPHKIKDFKHNLVLSCEQYNRLKEKDAKEIKFEDLKKFDTPEDLIDWVENKRFAKGSNSTNLDFNYYFQYYNDHLFAQISFINNSSDKPKWEVNQVEFWDYVFFRINGEYLFIVLVYEDDPDLGGIIIPRENEPIAGLDGVQYFEKGMKIDTIHLSRHLSSKSFYRVKEVKNGFELRDKLFQEPILDEVYEQIELNNTFIICRNKNDVTIYDKSASRVIADSLKAAYSAFGAAQYIRDNKIQWVDYKGVVHDTFPEPKRIVCGTISSTDRRITSSQNEFFESYETGYWGDRRIRDSVSLTGKSKTFKSIKYLNNKTKHYYDEYSGLNAVFRFPYSYYHAEEESTHKLLSIVNKRDHIESQLIHQRDHKAKGQNEKDSIDAILEDLKDQIKQEVIFEGDFESFGYFHPIKFKEEGLYGYYPINDNGKYKNIGQFNFFFAEFETKDGAKGWLDLYGKEYYKE